jgi:hydrogenase/urease accessory protein HupE|tara:strand:+ start:3123 stop:4094 length:972 start_codon:yes stop_codon:yes gene_type:complete
MRFIILKTALVFLATSIIANVFAHNKNPNTLIVSIEDTCVSIYSKSFSRASYSNFEINVDRLWVLNKNQKSTFQTVQIEKWIFLSPNENSIAIKSNNDNPTAVQLQKNGVNISWLETQKTFDISLQNNVSIMGVMKNYTLLGIEHILIGFDHLLFILGLLFVVRRKSILWTITAFTIAHSITLGLAVSDWLIPVNIGISAIWVETMIAVSILILALEMRKETKHSTQKAVGIAFTFGLLHGLGFAGVLQELGLPDTAFWHALVSFNIGVELGQLLFIAILVLLFQFIKKAVSFEKLTAVLSILVGGLAALWCIERTLLLANLI